MQFRWTLPVVFSLPLIASPTISVQPAVVNTLLPNTFSVNVVASDVTDLFAFQFDLGFDPSILAANSVSAGPFLAPGGPDFFIAGTIDNLGGTITGTANTLLTAVSGVSGSGTLASFQLRTVGPGSSPVNIFNLILLDSSLSGIAASVQNGSVAVTVSGAPEPGTALLLCGGLLLAMCLRRRSLACLVLAIAPTICAGQVFDTTPPLLAGFSFTPNAVDVTSGLQVVTVNLRVTDDISGVLSSFDAVLIEFRSPTGNQRLFGVGTPLPGSLPLNANFQADIGISQYSESGKWTVYGVTLRDAVGNTSFFDTAALASMSFPTVLTVTSVPDTTPPTLTSVSFNPPVIDVSAGPQSVALSLGVSDSASGVTFALVDFRGPSGQFVPQVFLTLASGTGNAGIWSGTVVFPRYAETGMWAISSVLLQDGVTNQAILGTAQLQALGFPAGVQITSTPTDITPPVLTGLTITPLTVNTSIGSQTIDLSLRMTDNLSGVYFYPPFVPFPNVVFRSPSGIQSLFPSSAFVLDSGTPLNGQWHTALMLPQFSEGGTWTLDGIFMVDALNLLRLNTAQLRALGFPTSFVVFQPSLTPDGGVSAAGGTVSDTVFGSRASLTFPAGAVSGPTSVAIDVLSSPLSVPTRAGFSTSPASFFTNIELNPQPAFPLPPPGLTLTLPLSAPITAGTVLSLYRLDPLSGLPVPAQDSGGNNIQGAVNLSGLSVTFTGVSRLSTVVAYLPITGSLLGDVNRDGKVDCADIAIVKAAFGKKPGQAGFDPRADVNQDGVIDIRDLTLVSRQLPKGMSCQ